MLSTLEVRTDRGELLSLSLDNPTSGIIVANIDGLDPAKATIVSSDFALLDGTQYQNSRREARDIKITLEPDADYSEMTVQELRKRLYRFFMPKTHVRLRFYMESGLVVETSGRVESFEAPLFTQDPKADIVVRCFDPNLYELEDSIFEGATTESMDVVNLFYTGTVDSGFIFEMAVNRAETAITIYQQPPNGMLRSLDFTAPMVSGDLLTISTIPGKKGAWLTRAGTKSSVLYGVLPTSDWLYLEPGQNDLRFYTTGVPIPFTMTYTNKHGGL